MDNVILGDGKLDTRIVDGEVFINADKLAELLTEAAVFLIQHALANNSEYAAGMASGYSELIKQMDNLRAQLLQDHAEASYKL